MLFLVDWSVSGSNRDAANARFKETGGPPPKGVKMIGRWHGVNGCGVVIAETSDTVALGKWLQQWSDLIEFDVTPVVDDAGVMKIMK